MGGTLTIGMPVAFLAYKDPFSQRVGKCLDTAVRLGLLTVHGERIADIALVEPEPGDGGVFFTCAPAVIGQKVALSARDQFPLRYERGPGHCRFRPRRDARRLRGGCRTVGCGKTTLLKILAGLLRPTVGTLLIDDIPIDAIGSEAYRAQIGVVLQDDWLFAGSIAENIAGFTPR